MQDHRQLRVLGDGTGFALIFPFWQLDGLPDKSDSVPTPSLDTS
jgi:hypothetical protein